MSSAPPRSEIPTLADLPLVIASPRLTLRPHDEGDAERFFPYVSDPDVARYVTWGAHTSVDQTREWLRAGRELVAKGTDVIWTIEHEGAPIGCVGLHGITWTLRAVRFDKAEMGYWIAKPFWGKGLMTDAATLAARWGFETLGLHKITIGCFEPNIGSRRVIEKIGFRFLCRYEDDVWRDGRWFAHLRYELLASEWADTTRTLRFNRPS